MTYDQGLWITTFLALLVALWALVSYAAAPNTVQAVRVEAQATLNARVAVPATRCPVGVTRC